MVEILGAISSVICPNLLKTIKLHGSSLLMEVLLLGGLGTSQGKIGITGDPLNVPRQQT